MNRNIWNILLLVPISYVFAAHVYKDYKSTGDGIRPVYNSMRASYQHNPDSDLNTNEFAAKKRIKRNLIPLNHDEVIKRSPTPYDPAEYYDTQTSESNNDWAVMSQGYPFNDLVCTRRSEAQTHITVSEPSTSAAPFLNFALMAKYALILFLAFVVKALLFKLLIIPLKLLIGLKALSFINSLLLGALLFKAKFRKSYGYQYPFTGMPMPPAIPGTVVPMPGTTPAAATSSSSSSSAAAASDAFDDEYVDVVRPGEDLKRILDYVKKRNKNW